MKKILRILLLIAAMVTITACGEPGMDGIDDSFPEEPHEGIKLHGTYKLKEVFSIDSDGVKKDLMKNCSFYNAFSTDGFMVSKKEIYVCPEDPDQEDNTGFHLYYDEFLMYYSNLNSSGDTLIMTRHNGEEKIVEVYVKEDNDYRLLI